MKLLAAISNLSLPVPDKILDMKIIEYCTSICGTPSVIIIKGVMSTLLQHLPPTLGRSSNVHLDESDETGPRTSAPLILGKERMCFSTKEMKRQL